MSLSKCYIGMDVNVPDYSLASWQRQDAIYGGTLGKPAHKIRRSFLNVQNIAYTVAADKEENIISFVSLKPLGGWLGSRSTDFDVDYTRIAKSLPAGTRLTINHEPENDGPGKEFVSMFKHVYTVLKTANPELRIGPVHLIYGWRNGVVGEAGDNPTTQPMNDWLVPETHVDYYGGDVYSNKGLALENNPQFQQWYQFFLANTKSKPINIVEYGQCVTPPSGIRDPIKEAKRAKLITADAAYLDMQPRVRVWLLWNATGKQGDWSLRDKASQDAWRAVVEAGRK